MHHIQAKILAKLLYTETLGYAALRPEGVESNHFAYHLEQLFKSGLVCKQGKHYTLSPAGLAYVDRLSHGKMVPRLQPHIATAIHITNKKGETLLFQRHFQPYINRWGLPLGKTHFHETVAQSASRELYEKTGLTHIPLTQRGIIYAETSQQGEVISKVLAHVYVGQVNAEPQLLQNQRGSCMWADPDEIPKDARIPWLAAVLELLANTPHDEFFFKEILVSIP